MTTQRVTCGYCSVKLIVEVERAAVSTHRYDDEDTAPQAQPEARLFTRDSPHFELSLIEQEIAGAMPELFRGVDLDDGRFALVTLRVVDAKGTPLVFDLTSAFEVIRTSLTEDGDPGLAANLALERLCEGPFHHKLECCIVLFEPEHMHVLPYAAGMPEALVWASSEEGRCIVRNFHREPLERKMLRATADNFSNGAPIQLAAADLMFLASAGFLGRGVAGYARGLRPLLDVANAHLGEEPLRLVTLAKNAFWEQRAKYPNEPFAGDVRIAAVRAVPPASVNELPDALTTHTFRTRRFELSLLAREGDAFTLVPLADDRQVLVWLSSARRSLPEGALACAMPPITALLDGDTGDNENPRAAGRHALEAMAEAGHDVGDVKIAVIQLFDRYERVKYFRRGVAQPVLLGARGVRAHELMQFDEGGEVTVREGERLFFLGRLLHAHDDVETVETLSRVWRGGKASRLYEAVAKHWKTKKTELALRQLALASLSDAPAADAAGLALVTGVKAL